MKKKSMFFTNVMINLICVF